MTVPVLFDGVLTQMDIPLPSIPSPRNISAGDFLKLWTVEQYAKAMADQELAYAQARVVTQGVVNLDSAELPLLLQRAVAIGAITQADADRIIAGTPPS